MAERVSIADLVLDYTLYPRHNIDSVHVADLVCALAAGSRLPPIVADRRSRRVVDGFHRVKAVQRYAGDNAEVEVEWREYEDDAHLFADAMKSNSTHGQKMRRIDQTHAILRAESLGLEVEVVAEALRLTIDRVKEMKMRSAIDPAGGLVPVKPGLRWLKGQQMTPEQYEGNRRQGGLGIIATIRQVRNLLEYDLIPMDYEEAWQELRELAEAISNRLMVRAT